MKQPLLIVKTPRGKQLRPILHEELQAGLDCGKYEHVRANLYQTKVMQAMPPVRADARESCIGQKTDAQAMRAQAAKDELKVDAAIASKRGRGRPRKAR